MFTKETMSLPIPKRMFSLGGEPDNKPKARRINHYCRMSHLNIVKEALKKHEEQWGTLSESQFGYLLEKGNEVAFSVNLAHYMLSRQLMTSKKHEIWMQFGGAPFRFSIQKFAAATGLRCCKTPNIPLNYKNQNNWKQLIGDDVVEIDSDWIERKLKSSRFNDPEKRLQLCCLLLVDALLCPTNANRKISPLHVELVSDVKTFLKYPWGRKAFSLVMKSVKDRGRTGLCGSSMAIQGFVHGMQLAILKCIPRIRTRALIKKKKIAYSEDEDEEEEVNDNKSLTISMRRIKDMDIHPKAIVTATLRVEGMSEDDLKFTDEVNDKKVDNLLKRIENGRPFTINCWKGGKNFKDIPLSGRPVQRKRLCDEVAVCKAEVKELSEEYQSFCVKLESYKKRIIFLVAKLAKKSWGKKKSKILNTKRAKRKLDKFIIDESLIEQVKDAKRKYDKCANDNEREVYASVDDTEVYASPDDAEDVEPDDTEDVEPQKKKFKASESHVSPENVARSPSVEELVAEAILCLPADRPQKNVREQSLKSPHTISETLENVAGSKKPSVEELAAEAILGLSTDRPQKNVREQSLKSPPMLSKTLENVAGSDESDTE